MPPFEEKKGHNHSKKIPVAYLNLTNRVGPGRWSSLLICFFFTQSHALLVKAGTEAVCCLFYERSILWIILVLSSTSLQSFAFIEE